MIIKLNQIRRARVVLLTALLAVCAVCVQAQIATNLKISEVVVSNPAGLIDEYGKRPAWIEICNTSYGTVDLRSCYLTTNRKVLENMSVPERIRLMSPIPRGDGRTKLKAQGRVVFFADGETNLGTLHTNFTLNPEKENFIALYDGNGHTLLDSVTVPPCQKAGNSYARFLAPNGKYYEWKWTPAEKVTPGSPNSNAGVTDSKVAEFKERDPQGFGMSILGMGIVLSCLVLLSIFFYLFGKIFAGANKERPNAQASESSPAETDEEDCGAVAAVIAMALKQQLYDLHDHESGVLTIKPRHTNWTRMGNSN